MAANEGAIRARVESMCARRPWASGRRANARRAPTPPPIHSYNRPESDFGDRAAYDDYLEAREDIS